MAVKEKPIWLIRGKEEIESLVVKLAKQGLTSERIGLVLRDTYGIPSTKIIAGKITKILKKQNIEQKPSDLMHLKEKIERLQQHIEKNKQDKVAKRGLQITAAKIAKLTKYYGKKKLEKKA